MQTPAQRECFERALKLLDQRPHTVCEIRRKLRQRDFPAPLIDGAVQELIRLGLLNDAEFASAFIREKLGSGRPVGFKKIALDLSKRGVDRAEIDRAHRELQEDEPLPDELDLALHALDTKLRILRTSQIDPKTRQKLWRFLANRGFSPETIRTAIDNRST
jgi:regulatory protein